MPLQFSRQLISVTLQTAKGHGGAVNDIAVQPSEPELFLTASQVLPVTLIAAVKARSRFLKDQFALFARPQIP